MDYSSDTKLSHIDEKIPFEHNCSFSVIFTRTIKWRVASPPTSCQLPPTSGFSDWLNRDLHMAYTDCHINEYRGLCLKECHKTSASIDLTQSFELDIL